MKLINLTFCIIGLFISNSLFSQGTTINSDTIFTDVWIKSNSPYSIEKDIVIPQGNRLTIEPGVKIEFKGHYKIKIYGELRANGVNSDSIIFTINDNTGFDYSDSTIGSWAGLQFLGDDNFPDTSILQYCIIEYSKSLSDNSYGRGGAIYSNNSIIKIHNCDIRNNYANQLGGGIYSNDDTLFISDCIVRNNHSFFGGGIQIYKSDLYLIQRNRIYNNKADYGGGICVSSGNGFVSSNLIHNNHAVEGGGGVMVDGYSDKPKIYNNTICNNYAEESGSGMLFRSDAILKNNIIWNNYSYPSLNVWQIEYNETTPDVQNCNIQDILKYLSIEKIQLGSNISSDPLFTDTVTTDGITSFDELPTYLLSENSFCINSGNADTSGLNLTASDFHGFQRIHDENIDIGACEFQNTIENRTPKLVQLKNIYMQKDSQSSLTFYIEDLDGQDKHTVEIVPENNNIVIDSIIHENRKITFYVTSENNWVGQTNILLKITDSSGESNASIEKNIDLKVIHGPIEYISENIIKDTIWEEVAIINGDIIIQDSVTLEIRPGTSVIFNGYYEIINRGTIIAKGISGDSILFTINDTSYFSNESYNYGGWKGILFDYINESNDTSILSYCSFSYGKNINNWDLGGVVKIKSSPKIIIQNSFFTNNVSGIKGGGISIARSDIIVKNNLFYKNHTKNGSSYISGGAMSVAYSNPLISNNFFFNNSAEDGGAICYDEGTVRLYGNTFSNNTARAEGGAIYISGRTQCEIVNNTVVNNYAGESGGGLKYDSGKGESIIANTIFWNNMSGNSNVQIDIYGMGIEEAVEFWNCDIQGDSKGIKADAVYPFYSYDYQNNFGKDPLFNKESEGVGAGFDGMDADWAIAQNSPCVNKGNNTFFSFIDSDIAGNPRIYDGSVDIIDIGAFELQMESTNVSINNKIRSADYILIYPNPSSGIVFIDYSKINYTNSIVSIFNMQGQNVFMNSYSGDNIIKLDLTNLNKGIYLVNIRSDNCTLNKKIILN